MSTTCSTCGAEVIWARTVTGRLMPVDPEPVPGGNIELIKPNDPREPLEAHVVTPWFGEKRHVSHFVGCPQADQHRRVGGR